LSQRPTSAAFLKVLGDGFVALYGRGPGGRWTFEGERPKGGWHRHDWRPIRLTSVGAAGLVERTIWRRRWRKAGSSETRLDRCPDEVLGTRASLVLLLTKLWSWLASGKGLYAYEEVAAPLGGFGVRRTLQRWLRGLQQHAVAWQQALRTAVIERLEPQPVEKLFPGGLSPPGAVSRRRWKDQGAIYSLHTGMSFLFAGAPVSGATVPVLLAEALRRLRAPVNITVA
jgi:hypothetical protein